MPIPDFQSYSEFIYALPAQYPRVQHSNLVLASIGPTLGRLQGHVTLNSGVELDVWELLDFASGRILNYSYEVYQEGEKIAWYDPFEHPHIPDLASTHPHHKHVLPDIKHNRIPAPGISFTEPNLTFLIEEIIRGVLPSSAGQEQY